MGSLIELSSKINALAESPAYKAAEERLKQRLAELTRKGTASSNELFTHSKARLIKPKPRPI